MATGAMDLLRSGILGTLKGSSPLFKPRLPIAVSYMGSAQNDKYATVHADNVRNNNWSKNSPHKNIIPKSNIQIANVGSAYIISFHLSASSSTSASSQLR